MSNAVLCTLSRVRAYLHIYALRRTIGSSYHAGQTCSRDIVPQKMVSHYLYPGFSNIRVTSVPSALRHFAGLPIPWRLLERHCDEHCSAELWLRMYILLGLTRSKCMDCWLNCFPGPLLWSLKAWTIALTERVQLGIDPTGLFGAHDDHGPGGTERRNNSGRRGNRDQQTRSLVQRSRRTWGEVEGEEKGSGAECEYGDFNTIQSPRPRCVCAHGGRVRGRWISLYTSVVKASNNAECWNSS